MEQSARRRLLNSVFDIKETKSRSSLSPNGSTRSLKLRVDTLSSEQSINSSISNTPKCGFRSEPDHPKPISLVIIEKYFSDICQSIASKGIIEPSLLSKAATMQDVLKDCLTVIHDLSLQFYVLMASALKEIQQIEETKDQSLYSTLAKKLLQLADLIEENKYTSKTDRASVLQNEVVEDKDLQSISKELLVRISRVTVRVLNIWKKILSPQREAAVISCAFLLLFCEVDVSLKISPNSRIPIDQAIQAMKNYISSPGKVVTVLRKTKEFIDKEMISVDTFKRIHDLLTKVTVNQVKTSDKTLTAFALYDFIIYAVRYFEAYAFEHYKLKIFDLESKSKSPISPFESSPSVSKNESKSPAARPKSTISQNKTNEVFKKSRPVQKSAQFAPVCQKKLEPSNTQRSLQNHSTSPIKSNIKINNSPSKGIRIEDPTIQVTQKPLDKSLLVAKKLITSTPKSNSNRTTPVRNRKNIESSTEVQRTRDVLEEMQYQQFIEEKFRHFLVDKLRKESEKMIKNGTEKHEIRLSIEIQAVKNKENWIEEFEKFAGVIRFNAGKRLSEDKRFTAELIRAQRQLDILQRYS